MPAPEPPLVKICGVMESRHARAAASLGADFIGMVFAPSRRQVTMGQAAKIAQALGKREAAEPSVASTAQMIEALLAERRPLLVGVFADQDVETINGIAEECSLDLVQLSGSEPWEMCRTLNRPVLKCLKVTQDHNADELLSDVHDSAIPLLDPYVSGTYGGTGQTLDWEVAAAVAQQVRLVLAGGLTPENVAQAVAQVHPWAVDVSSGVETDGAKDVDKMRAFIQAAKQGLPS
jgi:phosphoribosylanthranilate isomerase